ncbi:MAG TPA: HD domain-containing protein [Actinomycetota bacterium]|nr:HD domain-containing protein [Actinomycetota bacterium]
MSDPVTPRDPQEPAAAVRTPDEPAPRVPVEPFPERSAPTPPGPSEVATVTLEDVQANEELSLYIASADRVMEAMGYTEHGFRHANLVAKIAYQVLTRLGFTDREATLASVAGYLHDVGNALARDAHGQTGAILVYQSLRDAVPRSELMPILAAIANHEETEGVAVSPISAAVILADKSDVHRTRVRRTGRIELDVHDRVNHAVERSFLSVDSEARTVSLELTIDTGISKVMEYFEIFLGRMQLCRHAAELLDARFRLVINEAELA